jgi:hypothetical protein
VHLRKATRRRRDESQPFQTQQSTRCLINAVTVQVSTSPHICGVEVWRGGLGGTYLLPALSFAGASLVQPCFRFHTPLIEPGVRICRIRLSEKTHAIAVAIACDAVCNS